MMWMKEVMNIFNCVERRQESCVARFRLLHLARAQHVQTGVSQSEKAERETRNGHVAFCEWFAGFLSH
jgi:hypothetical protein